MVALISFAPKGQQLMVPISLLTMLMLPISIPPSIITLLENTKPTKQEKCGLGSKLFPRDSWFLTDIASYGTYLGEIPEAPETYNVVGNINEYGMVTIPFFFPSASPS
jgi:hypothetical protein